MYFRCSVVISARAARRRELEGLQRQLRQIDQMGAIANQKPRTIDWAYYRSLVKTPGVVDEAEVSCSQTPARMQVRSISWLSNLQCRWV